MKKNIFFTTFLLPFVLIAMGILLIIPGCVGNAYYISLPWTCATITEIKEMGYDDDGYICFYGDFEYNGKNYENVLLTQQGSSKYKIGDAFDIKVNPNPNKFNGIVLSNDWYVAIIMGAILVLIAIATFVFIPKSFYEDVPSSIALEKHSIKKRWYKWLILVPGLIFILIFFIAGMKINMMFYSFFVFCIYIEIVLYECFFTTKPAARQEYLKLKRKYKNQ